MSLRKRTRHSHKASYSNFFVTAYWDVGVWNKMIYGHVSYEKKRVRIDEVLCKCDMNK